VGHSQFNARPEGIDSNRDVAVVVVAEMAVATTLNQPGALTDDGNLNINFGLIAIALKRKFERNKIIYFYECLTL
jgi:hypothetical protein